jgi:hydroxymethylpyrimidine pyrophosphatase-like HAD family hydrolase
MIMLACDLDNTLIYGKPASPGAYTPAESVAGKTVTYISKKALALLENLDPRIAFVPVTARSIEEYRRVGFFASHIPRCAVTSLGGVILKDGEIDAEWQERCRKIAAPVSAEMEALCARARNDARVSRARIVDDVYLFVKSKAAETVAAEIAKGGALDRFTVLRRKEKIYVVPKGIDKGCATQRAREMLGAHQLLAAGDSEADIPFLALADCAFVPREDAAVRFAVPRAAVPPVDSDFAAFILESAVRMLHKYRGYEGKKEINYIFSMGISG